MNDAAIATPNVLVDHLFRNRAGQMVAYLTRLLGPEHLDLAEEVVQEALLKALQNWPYSGIPQNPAGWLFRVARNAALDAIRHRTLAGERNVEYAAQRIRDATAAVGDDVQIGEQLRDDELRMILMCCHPALPRDARVALSLKTSAASARARLPALFSPTSLRSLNGWSVLNGRFANRRSLSNCPPETILRCALSRPSKSSI